MNNRDVKSVFVKLIAGLMLAFMLISVTVPVVFATEDGTEQQTESGEQTTTSEETEPEGTEGESAEKESESIVKLTDEKIGEIADLLKGNDAARQLFLAAYGFNKDGVCYKYTESYLNDKGEFAIDSTEAGMAKFEAVGTWEQIKDNKEARTDLNEYVLEILADLKKAADSDIELPTELTKGYEEDGKVVVGDVEKIVDKMKAHINLEDNGWFLDIILRAIGFVLNWTTKYLTFGTNNYVLSLLYFAIIVELLMIPMAISQQKNSIKQAKLRPKEMAIRKRYAGRNDQATMQKVNQEIQDLYQREHFSPFSGCLPLLIQLPIVIALYQVVINPVFYVLGCAKPFADTVDKVPGALQTFFTTSPAAGGLGGTLNSSNGTIEILSRLGEKGKEAFAGLESFSYFSNSEACWDHLNEIGTIPSFNIGDWNMGLTPSSVFSGGWEYFGNYWWLLLVPVLTFAIYFASMKINRKLTYQPTTSENDKATGCSNNMMDFLMPLMSVYIAFMVPAAVGIYWMFKSVLGTVKQLIMKKAMPIPVFTEEDYKAAEKELYGKNPPKPKTSSGSRNPNVRSLHHIDDDEYDEKGNYIGPRETPVQEESTQNGQKNQQAPAMAEPLKDESDKKHTESDKDDSQKS